MTNLTMASIGYLVGSVAFWIFEAQELALVALGGAILCHVASLLIEAFREPRDA